MFTINIILHYLNLDGGLASYYIKTAPAIWGGPLNKLGLPVGISGIGSLYILWRFSVRLMEFLLFLYMTERI